MPVRFAWEYYAGTIADMDQVDRNWDAINPDLGVVSLPNESLAQLGAIPLGIDPSDSKKSWTWLRAYHSLHCLVSGLSTIVWVVIMES